MFGDRPQDWATDKVIAALRELGKMRDGPDPDTGESYDTINELIREAASRLERSIGWNVRLAAELSTIKQQVKEWTEYGVSRADMLAWLKEQGLAK